MDTVYKQQDIQEWFCAMPHSVSKIFGLLDVLFLYGPTYKQYSHLSIPSITAKI